MESMHPARWYLKATPTDFKPYEDLTITAVILVSLPNSGPNMVHTFSLAGACIYVFKISSDFTSTSQSYSHYLSKHNTGIHDSCWCICHVFSCHKPSLTSEVLNFDIHYHMTLHKLDAYECFLLIWKDLKCHFDILKLFRYSFCLYGIAILGIQGKDCSTVSRSSMPN